MLRQTIALFVALLVGIAIFGGVESFSSSFQNCVSEETAKAAANKDDNQNYSLSISARSYARCTERFADTHNALITALAAVLLAVITLGLVWSAVEQQNTTRAELRAYLSGIIGQAIYQERRRELRFEAKPVILNNGQTPAYNVRLRIKADIFTDAAVVNFVFTEPPDVPQSQASIGPHENRIMSAIVADYVPDDEIQDILDGAGKALWVWGVVHYDDVFGRSHFTQFCQRLWWLRDRSNVMGAYSSRFGLSN